MSKISYQSGNPMYHTYRAMKKDSTETRQLMITNKQKILKEVAEKTENNLVQQQELIEKTIGLSMDKFYKKEEELSEINKLEHQEEMTS